MKSFFKKLSLVLAAAMVITMLPAQIAKAAPTALKIRKDSQAKAEATYAPTYELKVGDQIDITFDGAKGYDAAAKLTKKWSSKDTTVATVDGNGLITAKKPGTTTITISCTAKGVEYQGTAIVNVTDSKDTIEVRQTGKEAITVFFASEADAKQNKDKIKVGIVQTGAKTRVREIKVKPVADKDTVVISNLQDGVEYQVSVAGKDYNVVMSIGTPDHIEFYYEPVEISTATKLDGDSAKKATAVPIVKVISTDNKEIDVAMSELTFKQLDKTGHARLATGTSSTKGQVNFSEGDYASTCKVQVTYTYTDTATKTKKTKTEVATATATEYKVPTLRAWAESIALTNSNNRGKKVTYASADSDFKATLKVNQTGELAFYIVDSNGKNHTGLNVNQTVVTPDKNDNNNSITAISAVKNTDYKYYFVKDDTDASFISLPTIKSQVEAKATNNNKVEVRALKSGGSETVSLYRVKGTAADPNKDYYLGSIEIKVEDEAVATRIEIENEVTGYYDAFGTNRVVEVPFTIYDQYDNPITASIDLTQHNGVSLKEAIKDGKGTLVFNFANIPGTLNADKENKPLEIKLKIKYTDIVETLSVSSYQLQQEGEQVSLELKVDAKNAVAKNAYFKDTTELAKLGFNITVAQTISGIQVGEEDFAVISNDLDNETLTASQAGKVYVVIYNASNDKPIEADKAQDIPALTASNVASIATGDSFFFDLYKTSKGTVADDFYTPANLKVVAYQIGDDGTPDPIGDAVVVEVANNMEYIQKVSSTYQLKIDGNTAVEDTSKAVTTAKGTFSTALVQTIVGQLYGWYDANSNDKADKLDNGNADPKEINTLYNLTNGTLQIIFEESKYYEGISKELYIKYVTVKYKTPVGAWVEQRIDIDRKFILE